MGTSSSTAVAPAVEGPGAEVSPPAPRVEHTRARAVERRKRKAREAAARGEKTFKVSFEDWAAGMARKITPEEIARENAAQDVEDEQDRAPPPKVKAEVEAAIDARRAADLEARAAAFRAAGGFTGLLEGRRHG